MLIGWTEKAACVLGIIYVYTAFYHSESVYFCDTTYTSQQGQCHYNTSQSGASMSGIVSILSGKEDDLLAAVATVGPISAAVDASSNAFRVCVILRHKLKTLCHTLECYQLLQIAISMDLAGLKFLPLQKVTYYTFITFIP